MVTESRPKTVLLLRFSAIGDIVLTSPAVDALARAWPETRIIFATKARFVPLVAHHPSIADVVGLEAGESVWALRRRLAAFRPAAVLDLHGKARGMVLRLLVPSRRRVLCRKRPRLQELRVRMGLSTYRADMRISARYHAAVEALVGDTLAPGQLRYFVGEPTRVRVRELLAKSGIDLDRPVVGMAPGAMWETKRWPPERFGALAARCIERGNQVVLTGSPAEASVIREVAAAAPGAVVLTDTLTLEDLGGLIERCRAFVANDSGPMHIARALGTPTLAIFGSTDPGQFDLTGHELLFAEVPCSPCSLYGLRRCPESHFDCMRRLYVDTAWESMQRLLEGGRRPFVAG
ncbi:MAG: glycosyltransferase family 9 protein [Myxococcota bacterium]